MENSVRGAPGVRSVPSDDLRASALTRWERATGLALGEEPGDATDGVGGDGDGDPRAALVAFLVTMLARDRCVVSFSGGRDSSAVLAVATEVARREGLPLPVPVTLRFPGVGSTEESRWQELVVAHLGISDWERITIGDELDLIGTVARGVLGTHGLLWPPNAHVHVPILDRARGACVLTGWDGDGLFGLWRWARAQAVVHGRARPQPRDVLRVPLALAPPRARRRWMRPHVLSAVPWVRDGARAELDDWARADAAREPRRWDRRLAYYRRRRYVRLTVRSLDLLGRARGVTVAHPLLAPGFLAALARDGGSRGYGDRAGAMRALFGDLLPSEVIVRRAKAEFGRALWSGESRAFATGWTGAGVDLALVDPDRLRREWTRPSPRFGANTLLQQAWLAARPKI
ncbi:MAG: asparagine synthase-related protein [Solirubrobacteraceae bacterium]